MDFSKLKGICPSLNPSQGGFSASRFDAALSGGEIAIGGALMACHVIGGSKAATLALKGAGAAIAAVGVYTLGRGKGDADKAPSK